MSKNCDKCGAYLCRRCGKRAPVTAKHHMCVTCKQDKWGKPWRVREDKLLRMICDQARVKGYLMAASRLLDGRSPGAISRRVRELGYGKGPGHHGGTPNGVCCGCEMNAGQRPVLEVRGDEVYVLCQSCAEHLEVAA